MANINDGLRELKLFETLEDSITLIVKTKSPEKWLLVDRETGQIFQGSKNGHWDRLDPVIKE
jgi:hypothetical protein